MGSFKRPQANNRSALLDRLDRTPRYLECIASLAGCCGALNAVNGDDLALLIDLIREDAERNLSALRADLVPQNLGVAETALKN